MNIIITGASGLVGSSAVKISSQNPKSIIHAVSINHPNVKHPSNVLLYRNISELPSTNHYDLLFHAAAATPSNTDPSKIYDTNKLIDHDIYSFVNANSVNHVTYLSSMSIYGTISSATVTENTPSCSPTPYGQSKLDGEKLFRSSESISSLSILRLPGIVGSSMSKIFFRRVYESLLSSSSIKVRSPDSLFNNAVYVDDIFNTSISLMINQSSPSLVLNMHSSDILPIESFLSLFARRLNTTLSIICDPNINPPFVIGNCAHGNLLVTRSLEHIIDSFCLVCGH